MTEKVGRPNDAKPDEWQQDLHPHPEAGINADLRGPHPEKDAALTRTADEIKELHQRLQGYTNSELKQIPILPSGSRLEQGAKYIDLNHPEQGEFTAMGNMEVAEDAWIVPKTEVDYQLWNRLTGVHNPDRTGEVNPDRQQNVSG
jgi:hypothetical protein